MSNLNVQRTNRHTDAVDYCTIEDAINALTPFWGDADKFVWRKPFINGRLMFTDDNDYQVITNI